MKETVASVAQGRALGLTVGGGGGIVAMFAEREGGYGGCKIDAWMGGMVLGDVAGGTEDGLMVDTEASGGGGEASIAHCAYAHQTGHELGDGEGEGGDGARRRG